LFQASSSERAYELSLDWDDLKTVDVIDLAVTSNHMFVAEFFDASGNTSACNITFTLECEQEFVSLPACDTMSETCWFHREVAGTDGLSIEEVCVDLNVYIAGNGEKNIARSATVSGP
jgi:hypothetical protein